MSRFFAGQHVLCVDGDFSRAALRYPQVTWPRHGGRYVVRGYACGGRYPAVLLRGITNPAVFYVQRWNPGVRRAEAGFWEERFEPATDIEELRALLRVREREDA